jgi:monoamine oxidase
MAHSLLGARLQSLVSSVAEAEHRHLDVAQVLVQRQSRRDFMRRAGVAAAVSASPFAHAAKATGPAPRIAVIGSGLAGLSCAYRLKQAGVHAEVFEANTRIGGRCWTNRGTFQAGQIAEHGGELIDQSHTRIRQLAQELRLPLRNVLAAEQNGTEPFFFFDGSHYSHQQATRDMKQIWQAVHRDLVQASYPTVYNSYTQRGWELDQMSIAEWINTTVPGGLQSRLGQLLDTAYNIEYGAETSVQSALNLIYLLGYSGQGQLRLFGPSNEKYHITGGNDQLITGMAAAVQNQIHTGATLTSVRLNGNGTYDLGFNGSATVTVDKVVLALPFSILRNSVDLSQAGFSVLKMTAINELQMGTNTKLNMQFNRRRWRELGGNGDSYSDQGYQVTWEVSRDQAGTPGILVNYTGGNVGASYTGSATQLANQFLQQVEPVMPGLTSTWNGLATVDYWPGNVFTRGSYSYWQVGQYTRFAGVEGEQEGNAHFCGEHTSIDAQGYLEGAVETGERVASEILADIA